MLLDACYTGCQFVFTRTGLARAAICLGDFYGLTLGRLPEASSSSCASCAAAASRPHCFNVSVRPTMSSEDNVEPAFSRGSVGGAGAGMAAALAV